MKKNLKIDETITIQLYKNMLKGRLVEEAVAEKLKSGEIQMGIHLNIGQEAIAAGVSENLNKGDYIFSNHRSHGHYIAANGNLERMFAELYGKATGCSSGKGGSMHLTDKDVGYLGSSSIVAGNIPIAVGVAMAQKYKGNNQMTVCFFGDGAVDEGAAYESFSFAALKSLPILFICENNCYAIFSHITARQKYNNIYKRFKYLGLPGERVDGNSAINVYNKVRRVIDSIRQCSGPWLLECVTYRTLAHAGANSDETLGYRTKEEVDFWKRRCPIKKLERFILRKNITSKDNLKEYKDEIVNEIESAIKFAQKSPFPSSKNLLSNLYSTRIVEI